MHTNLGSDWQGKYSNEYLIMNSNKTRLLSSKCVPVSGSAIGKCRQNAVPASQDYFNQLCNTSLVDEQFPSRHPCFVLCKHAHACVWDCNICRSNTAVNYLRVLSLLISMVGHTHSSMHLFFVTHRTPALLETGLGSTEQVQGRDESLAS